MDNHKLISLDNSEDIPSKNHYLSSFSVPKDLHWTRLQEHSLSILLHVFIWVFYRALLFYLNVYLAKVPSLIFWSLTAFTTLLEPLIFYIYYLYLIPKALEKRKLIYFIGVTLGAILIIPFLAFCYVQALQNFLPEISQYFRFSNSYWPHHLAVGFHILVFIGLASGARFAVDWFQNQQQKKQLESQNLLSEIALLRSQINPHFLFNTLNNIYTLSYKKDENTPLAILKLSDLMRYMLHEASGEIVLLRKEIKYIENYIELQKLRLKNPLNVIFRVSGNIDHKKIPPMLLIPFVENAFKHGVSSHNPSDIFFELEIIGDQLTFRSINYITKPQLIKSDLDEESGIGYKNVKKRLNLLYPHQHSLGVEEKENKYYITLTLNLRAYD